MKTKFYALCSGHNWTGKEHDTEEQAENEAVEHRRQYTNHHGKIAVYKVIYNEQGNAVQRIKQS